MELAVLVGEQDVGGLDVAVDQPPGMCRVERGADLAGDQGGRLGSRAPSRFSEAARSVPST